MKNIKKIKSLLTKKGSFYLSEQGNNLILSIDLDNEDDVYDVEILLERYGGDDTSALFDLLYNNGYIGNGWDVMNADRLGHLSEAPCILRGLDINDAGMIIMVEDTEVWYYDDYMITNPIEVLLENGSVNFTKL